MLFYQPFCNTPVGLLTFTIENSLTTAKRNHPVPSQWILVSYENDSGSFVLHPAKCIHSKRVQLVSGCTVGVL